MLIENYMNELAKDQAKNIDKTIIEFCKKQGYKTVKTTEDFIKIQNKLVKEDKLIRCEIFTKIKSSNEPTLISCETVVIPFIDSISNPIPISEVKRICKLGSEWY